MNPLPHKAGDLAADPLRRGSSLVELMAVIAINATLLGIIVTALAAITRTDRQFAEQYRRAEAHAPLIARLREDIHAAKHVHWDQSERRLRLELPNGATIVYLARGNRWERKAGHPTSPSTQGELTAAFHVPSSSSATVIPADAAVGNLVEIRWPAQKLTGPAPRSPKPQVELIAAVGRDARLLHE